MTEDEQHRQAPGDKAVSFVAYPEGTSGGEVRWEGPWRYTDSPVCQVNGVTVDLTDAAPGERREVDGWFVERTPIGVKASTHAERETALQEVMPQLRATLAEQVAAFTQLRAEGNGEATVISKFYNHLLDQPAWAREDLALLAATALSLLPASAVADAEADKP